MKNIDLVYRELATELKSIEDQIREIKSRQFTGTDTVQTYRNQTSDEWDIDWTPIFGSGQTEDNLAKNVLFTSDLQNAPVNHLTYEILINNSIHYKVGSFDDPDNDVAVNGFVHDLFLVYASLPPQPKLDSWYFDVSAYDSGMNIKVKFTVHSTDTGTVVVDDLDF